MKIDLHSGTIGSVVEEHQWMDYNLQFDREL